MITCSTSRICAAIGFVAGLALLPVEAKARNEPDVCAIGKAVLSRPPETGTRRTAENVFDGKTIYNRGDGNASNIFLECPNLAAALPPGTRLASDADRSRSTGIVHPDPLTIFWIGAPSFNSDRTEAVVQTGYQCPGLCAGLFESTYHRSEGRWVLVGEPRLVAVS